MRSAATDPFRAALIELCFERDYGEITIELLCERAGASREDFDARYRDLEDCFCEVYVSIRDRALATIRAALQGPLTWRQRIRAVAYALLEAFNYDERETHLSMVVVRTVGGRVALLMEEGVTEMFDLIDEGRGEREDSERVTRATAEAIGGSIFAWVAAAVGREFPIRSEVVPEMLYHVVLPYLGPEAAAEELATPPPLAPTPDLAEG